MIAIGSGSLVEYKFERSFQCFIFGIEDKLWLASSLNQVFILLPKTININSS